MLWVCCITFSKAATNRPRKRAKKNVVRSNSIVIRDTRDKSHVWTGQETISVGTIASGLIEFI